MQQIKYYYKRFYEKNMIKDIKIDIMGIMKN